MFFFSTWPYKIKIEYGWKMFGLASDFETSVVFDLTMFDTNMSDSNINWNEVLYLSNNWGFKVANAVLLGESRQSLRNGLKLQKLKCPEILLMTYSS